MWWSTIHSCAASRKPPVPHAGSATVSPGLGLQARDHRPDQRPRREVLAGARLRVLGALLQQPLVGVALEVGVDRGPGLLVDEVDDEPAQLGRVLDAVLRLAEDRAERARLLAERLEDVPVVHLQLVAVAVEQRLPVEPVRHDLAEPGLLALVGHLQEQQVRELLDVLDRRDAVVAQHVAEVPQLLHELVRVGGHQADSFEDEPRSLDTEHVPREVHHATPRAAAAFGIWIACRVSLMTLVGDHGVTTGERLSDEERVRGDRELRLRPPGRSRASRSPSG